MGFKLIDTRLYTNQKQTKFRVAYKNENGSNSVKTFSDKDKALAFREETKPISKRVTEILNQGTAQPQETITELSQKEVKRRGRPRNQEMEIQEIFNPIRETNGDFVIIISKDPNILNRVVSSYIN